ncbi:hypothetical protein AACG63_000940 [Staphylococcus pseudintermedius]
MRASEQKSYVIKMYRKDNVYFKAIDIITIEGDKSFLYEVPLQYIKDLGIELLLSLIEKEILHHHFPRKEITTRYTINDIESFLDLVIKD